MKIPPLHLRPLEAGVGEELAPRPAPLLPLHGADDGLGDVVVEPSPLRKLGETRFLSLEIFDLTFAQESGPT